MRKYGRWFTIPAALALVGLLGVGLRGVQAGDDPKAQAAVDVFEMWKPMKPKLDGLTDFQTFGGSPEKTPGVAGYSFRVVGPSFADLWTYYAELCGIEQHFDAGRYLNATGTGAKGGYVISERPTSDGQARALTVFVLRADHHSVTVTIRPDFDGKAILGSITAVTY